MMLYIIHYRHARLGKINLSRVRKSESKSSEYVVSVFLFHYRRIKTGLCLSKPLIEPLNLKLSGLLDICVVLSSIPIANLHEQQLAFEHA